MPRPSTFPSNGLIEILGEEKEFLFRPKENNEPFELVSKKDPVWARISEKLKMNYNHYASVGYLFLILSSNPYGCLDHIRSTLEKDEVASAEHNGCEKEALLNDRLNTDELADVENSLPAHLPSPNVLAVANYEAKKKTYLHENPVIALAVSMHEEPFEGVIHDVAYDKFSVRYHSASQIHAYKEYCKENKFVSISLDATGGIVKELQRTARKKSGPIYLYNMVIHDKPKGELYTLAFMLSERHDIESIRHWIAMWLNETVPNPNEVVVDMFVALMSAAMEAFNFLTLSNYLEECAKILGNENPSLSECFIRVDAAHCVKLIISWSSLKNKNHRIRQFYIKCMCQVFQATDKDLMKLLMKDICIVALSKTGGRNIETGAPVACEFAKQRLQKVIGKQDLNEDEFLIDRANIIANITDHNEGNAKSWKQTGFAKWFDELLSECHHVVTSEKGDKGNQHYLPNLIDDMKPLIPLLPMCTGIMVPYYGFGGSTVSTGVENSFKVLKKQTFKDTDFPLRPDEFVFQHIRSVIEDLKITNASNHDDNVSGKVKRLRGA